MSFYREALAESLHEKIAYFKSAELGKEAELLQARLSAYEEKSEGIPSGIAQQAACASPVADARRASLKAKLAEETRRIPELEKQYILGKLGEAKTLKELEPLRIAYIERLLKISRAARGESIGSVSSVEATGPYNNEKTFCEALQLIYAQDPLWIEDFKELYSSITASPSSSAPHS